jgi:hypothetical protein
LRPQLLQARKPKPKPIQDGLPALEGFWVQCSVLLLSALLCFDDAFQTFGAKSASLSSDEISSF